MSSSSPDAGLAKVIMFCAVSGVVTALVTGTLSYLILLALAIGVGSVAASVIRK